MIENKKELEELYNKLEELKRDFTIQLNDIDIDLREFHKMLMGLTKKYPEYSELLEFIVFINDKLETNQTQYRQIVSEVINKIIDYKKEIINNYKNKQVNQYNIELYNNLQDELQQSLLKINELSNKSEAVPKVKGGWLHFFNNAQFIKDIKWTAVSIMFIILIIASLISPNEIKGLISSVVPVINTISDKSKGE